MPQYVVTRYKDSDEIWYYEVRTVDGSFMCKVPCNQGVPQEYRNFTYVCLFD